jgi:hypothetical protein
MTHYEECVHESSIEILGHLVGGMPIGTTTS